MLIGVVVLGYYASIVAVDGWDGIAAHLRAQVTRIDRGDLITMSLIGVLPAAALTIATLPPGESPDVRGPQSSPRALIRSVVVHSARYAGFFLAMFACILVGAIVLPPKGG